MAIAPWELVCRSARRLDAALMPVRCVFCGVDCRTGEQAVCSGCAAELPRIGSACHGCARPLPGEIAGTALCSECQDNPGPFCRAVAPLAYEYPVDAAIKMFKFRRRLHYAPAFGALLCRAYAGMAEDIDALLPVPLHWRRHGYRGFNQAAELCKPLQTMTGLPMLTTVRRTRYTTVQSGLSAAERRRNLRDAFAVRGVISARHVLIVDDVITTGETTRQLAHAVTGAGAEKVSVLALARA